MTIKKKQTRKKKIHKNIDQEVISKQEAKINILENKLKILIYLIVCSFSSVLYHLDTIGKPNYSYVYGSIYIVVPALVGGYLLTNLDEHYESSRVWSWLNIFGNVILVCLTFSLWVTWLVVELLRSIVSFII